MIMIMIYNVAKKDSHRLYSVSPLSTPGSDIRIRTSADLEKADANYWLSEMVKYTSMAVIRSHTYPLSPLKSLFHPINSAWGST